MRESEFTARISTVLTLNKKALTSQGFFICEANG